MGWTLLLILALPQDEEVERLVRELGAERFEAREAAHRTLGRMGERALKAVRRAAESDDLEVRTRAREILSRIEGELALLARARERRPGKLRLVTINAKDAPVGDLLTRLKDQVGVEFDTQKIDLSRRASLEASEMPLLQALESMGLTFRSESSPVRLEPLGEPRPVVYAPGARFTFEMHPWPREGGPEGFVITTEKTDDFEGQLEWEIAAVRTDRDLPFESCAVHSPRKIFLRDPGLREPRVAIRALRRWYMETALEFKDPKDGDARRIGRFLLTLKWPDVEVVPDDPMPRPALERTLDRNDIKVTYRPGADGGLIRLSSRLGGSQGLISRATWCGCPGGPDKGPRKPVEMLGKRLVSIPTLNPPGDIASVAVTFHYPIEEAFEVVSPALK